MLRRGRLCTRHFFGTPVQRHRRGGGRKRHCRSREAEEDPGKAGTRERVSQLRDGTGEISRYGGGVCRRTKGELQPRLAEAYRGGWNAGGRSGPSRLHHQRHGHLSEQGALRRTGRSLRRHWRSLGGHHPHTPGPGRHLLGRPTTNAALCEVCHPTQLFHRGGDLRGALTQRRAHPYHQRGADSRGVVQNHGFAISEQGILRAAALRTAGPHHSRTDGPRHRGDAQRQGAQEQLPPHAGGAGERGTGRGAALRAGETGESRAAFFQGQYLAALAGQPFSTTSANPRASAGTTSWAGLSTITTTSGPGWCRRYSGG